MGNKRLTTVARDNFVKAVQGRIDSESVAAMIAACTVDDLRACWMSEADIVRVFDIDARHVKEFARRAGIPKFTFANCEQERAGGRNWYAKADILAAMMNACEPRAEMVTLVGPWITEGPERKPIALGERVAGLMERVEAVESKLDEALSRIDRLFELLARG